MKKSSMNFGISNRRTDVVETPKEFYDCLNEEFKFVFDPCPIDHQVDGLQVEWPLNGWSFVNPPFSQIDRWVRKGVEEMNRGAVSVFLIPFRGSNVYWKEFVWPRAAEIRFLLQKLKFIGYDREAPLNLCVVVFSKTFARITSPCMEDFGPYSFYCVPSCNQPQNIEEQVLEVVGKVGGRKRKRDDFDDFWQSLSIEIGLLGEVPVPEQPQVEVPQFDSLLDGIQYVKVLDSKSLKANYLIGKLFVAFGSEKIKQNSAEFAEIADQVHLGVRQAWEKVTLFRFLQRWPVFWNWKSFSLTLFSRHRLSLERRMSDLILGNLATAENQQ